MPIGYRINIEPGYTKRRKYRHHSGYSADIGTRLCECLNCHKTMFPAISLDFTDPKLVQLNIWKLPWLTLQFCPSCAFFMKPYYIDGDTASIITGGLMDGGKLVNPYMETEYECRNAALASPSALETHDSFALALPGYRTRQLEDGVYHQIGGLPIYGTGITMTCCKCSSQMPFSGILDYDDLNVPLYESNHQPVSLIVGDKDSMNVYLCKKCSVVGLAWAIG